MYAASFSVALKCPTRERSRTKPEPLAERERNPVPRNTVRDLAEAGEVFYCNAPLAFPQKAIVEEVKRRIGREVKLSFDTPPKCFGSWHALYVEPPGRRRPQHIHAVRMKFYEVY